VQTIEDLSMTEKNQEILATSCDKNHLIIIPLCSNFNRGKKK